ncbi:hydroxyisourate hydrolase [Cohnella yongneupensis]|uniref:5-hydroxyisourate hydrolase n=1 Tax=Cohnella yongneupensis TaxID=425006 RepID=A0ABW0R6P6_9BACL
MGGGRITTHVLDVAHGKPAAGMRVRLWKLDEALPAQLVKADRLNADGRLDEPLASAGVLTEGIYELVFEAGAYYKETWAEDLVFLDHIPVRFKVADESAHYHVPLLVAPGGYSTYRGT